MHLLSPLVVATMLAACSAPPDGAARAYLDGRGEGTGYPTLLKGGDLNASLAGSPDVFEASDMAGRLAALQARAAGLNGAVLTESERRALLRATEGN
ncbi:hypothetical protein [Algicella marina]|uniref:Uncharacterized protein n=1 Tax=Algicella marina TaxID=2683284 RepID=A0A6P1T1I6_9RHOB|nr:hypothetical protein [Algicella marina]QHQ35625.1 hypothetical protein GO499_10770 [Algicella marina]